MAKTLVLLVLAVLPIAAQRVTVPTLEHAPDMGTSDRQMLEALSSMSVEEAISERFLIPGTVVNFDNPGIAFIRDFNLWLNHRSELVRLYGADGFAQDINDVQDLIKFNNMADSYEEYCNAVDAAYQKHLAARRQMNRLRKQVERKQEDAW